MEKRELKRLLSEMSLQEKIGQMIQLTGMYFDEDTVLTGTVGEDRPPEWVVRYAGSVLGMAGPDKIRRIQKNYMEKHPHHIPLLFMADVIHGCRTIFPIPLGQACSFRPELVHEAAERAAAEASSEGLRATFSPMIDVSRDPRWGRIMESFGEDPFLNGVMGTAMLEGYQGTGGEKTGRTRIAGCLKHFAGYGAVNAGREYNDVELSGRTFAEQYLKPFRMAVKAEPAMVMTAFNAVDRRPVSGNRELLRNILRGEMGFDGTVISDWGSVGQLEEQRVVTSQKEAAYAAVNAGVDIDMMSPAYMFHLEQLVQEGRIPESLIDEAAWQVLRMKDRLGLFEDPYAGLDETEMLSEETKRTALRMALESCVLLKNEKILPLDPGKKAVWAGPYADSRELLSRWAIFGDHKDVETVREVLERKQIPARICPGCGPLPEEIGEDDTVVLMLGEYEDQSGEAASRAFLDLPEEQMELFREAARRTRHIVSVILSGRPLDLREIAGKSEAVLMAWRPGTMGAEAMVRLICGEESPSGKLAAGIPWCVGQVPVSYWDINTGHRMSESDPDNRFTSRYMDIPNTPLYPFGFGLSYTEFEIFSPQLEKEEGAEGGREKVHVSCTVKNVGEVPGAEVVQCYVETVCAPVVRPSKELIRFRKVFLEPGEEQEVEFVLDREEFIFYGKNMEPVDGGISFRVHIGNSSTTDRSAGAELKCAGIVYFQPGL